MDPIADMLVAISNAQRNRAERVSVPYSGFKKALLETLKEHEYIGSFREQEGIPGQLIISLSYNEDKSPRINGVKRLSTPGNRKYVTSKTLPYTYTGYGKVFISTSKGLYESEKARKEKLGGELVCAIW